MAIMGNRQTGKNQHVVPQQMIRSFAGRDGRLVELIKPALKIGTRRRSPKGILFVDDFYRDCVSDFDAELLTPIEQKFAPVYPRVLDRATLNGHEGAAFIDWISAILVRTQLVTNIAPLVPQGLPGVIAGPLNEAKKLFNNIMRSDWFTMYQDLLTRRDWGWKFIRFPHPCFVLSDHPVGITSVQQPGGQMVVVPMSSKVVVVGGARDAIEQMHYTTPTQINFFLAAYAYRSIFAGELATLEAVKASLSNESSFSAELIDAARKPLFGAPERMRRRMKCSPMPVGFDSRAAMRRQIESFGPHAWGVPAAPAKRSDETPLPS